MTNLTLRKIVEDALADIGVDPRLAKKPNGKVRTTTWLGIETGFGIRHYASGRNVYIVQTRMRGRNRTVTIAPDYLISLFQARMIARRVLAYAIVGRDLAAERKQVRKAGTMDRYIAEYFQRMEPSWKASTVKTQGIYRRLYIDGAFPDAHVDDLGGPEVSKWFAALTDECGPGGANRCMEILKAAMNKAEAWGYRAKNTNPCRGVRPNRKKHSKRFLSLDELARLGTVLARERGNEHRSIPVYAAAITMLVLTGCRVGEILSLQWDEVKGNKLRLRDSKTGPKTVWIGDEARALLSSMPRFEDCDKRQRPWVFWNEPYRQPIKSIHHYWVKIRDEAGLQDVRLHDLRHTFASHASMNAETLPMISRLLGHATVKSSARYTHLNDAHLLDANQQIGDLIENMLEGRSPVRTGDYDV